MFPLGSHSSRIEYLTLSVNFSLGSIHLASLFPNLFFLRFYSSRIHFLFPIYFFLSKIHLSSIHLLFPIYFFLGKIHLLRFTYFLIIYFFLDPIHLASIHYSFQFIFPKVNLSIIYSLTLYHRFYLLFLNLLFL